MSKALFLDRDGIINEDTGYTHRVPDFQFCPGIFALCKAARTAGYHLVIVTNQSGIARGFYRREDVHKLHLWMQQQLLAHDIPLAAIYYCPHHPDFSGTCLCRKPGSLMLEKGIAKFGINPSASFMIGDRERDILAGKAVGCQTILLGKGASEADYVVSHLEEIIPLISHTSHP